MKNIPTKSAYDGVTSPAPSTEIHAADEYEDRSVELQGAVTDAGQSLSAADAGQLSKAMFANGVAAQSMQVSGGVNTLELTPITGANGLRLATPAAPDYTLLDGAIFSFAANNTNTGNMTVNVGQTGGTLIGAQPLFLQDGSTEIPAGDVIAGRFYNVRYDSTLDVDGAFVLLEVIGGYRFKSTSVFSSTMSVASNFQDLDLSAIVGSNAALCFLQVQMDGAAGGVMVYVCRPKGEGSVTGTATQIFNDHRPESTREGYGSCLINFAADDDFGYVMCSTDINGVLEHGFTQTAQTINVKLIGYIK